MRLHWGCIGGQSRPILETIMQVEFWEVDEEIEVLPLDMGSNEGQAIAEGFAMLSNEYEG